MTRKGNLRQSDIDAINRYHKKTYKQYTIVFRIDDDKEIIDAIENAHAHGIAAREVIKAWFNASQF